MEKLTINDIAKISGYSIATVSNYLNGNYQKMSQKTRDHLAKVIDQTGYRPNSTARNLAKHENKTIGVSISDITNPFTSPVMSGISEVCTQHGYKMIFTNADNDQKKEVNNILSLRTESVSGMIVDAVDPNSPIYKSLTNEALVMVDRQAKELLFDTIVTDNRQAVKEMVTHMVQAGYDELYFVTWPLEEVSTRQMRYQGFLEATSYALGEHLLTVPHLGQKEAYQQFEAQIETLMAQKGTKKIGFFTMNARVFLRLLKAMQLKDYQYPRDYGVATYEEFDWMQIMRPEISCIRQDSKKIGVMAAELLLAKLLDKKSALPKKYIVPTEIILKQSF